MAYKFIEHRSDIIVEATAKNFVITLQEIAEAMFSQMGSEDANENDKIEINSKAPGRDELVVTFLSDVLAQCEIEQFTPKQIEIKKFNEKENSLTAVITGEEKVPKNIIKAVTYHELRVEETKGKCMIRVLFDI